MAMRVFVTVFFIVLVHILIVSPYKTYEIVKYCHRRQVINRTTAGAMFRPNKIYKIESVSDLIVRDNYDRYEDDDDYDDDDGDVDFNLEGVGHDEHENISFKSIVVDNSYDRSAVRVVLSRKHHRPLFKNWQHCALFVHAKRPEGLIVTVNKLRLRPGIDWLRLSINNGSFVREFSHVTIDDARDSVAYVANYGVLIELETGYSLQPAQSSDHVIELILTTYREADLCRIDDEFDCGSFRCISSYYLCDSMNNCGDGRDEVGCPIDNLTNYIIISSSLLLVALLIFLCICYRCFCAKKQRAASNRPYQYVKIRHSSISSTAPPSVRARSVSMRSDGRPEAANVSNIRRFKVTQVPDSMPLLVDPQTGVPTPAEDYGSMGNGTHTSTTSFYLPPYGFTYLGHNVGLIPAPTARLLRAGSLSASDARRPSVHHTFPIRPANSPYPVMHPQLFQPPPPPYTPREETASTSVTVEENTTNTDNK